MMLAMDPMEPAWTERASTIVLLPKKDCPFCFGVDYRKLNAVKIHQSYFMPHMTDCINSISGGTIFQTSHIVDNGRSRLQDKIAA